MLIRVYEAAADLQAVCVREDWRFCFIGGLALLRWSDPRMTDDADITLFTDFGFEEPYVDKLLAEFQPRTRNAREFALHSRVLLLQHHNGVPLDIGLGALPFEARSIERSSFWHAAEGCDLRTCCAEDLIVHKAFAAREQDWADIDAIAQRQGEKLDLRMVFDELKPLADLKEQPDLVERLRALLRKRGLRSG